MAKYLVQHRRGTAEQWSQQNTIIPKAGEIVIEIDDINSLHKLKIGDGKHTYSELAYLKAGDEIVTQVLTEAKPRVITVELANTWNLDADGKYSQAITLDNITKYSRLDLQPSADMLAEFKQLGLVFVTENKGEIENNSGTIIVHSVGNMPSESYTMQATIVETECNEQDIPVVGIPVGTPAAQADWDQIDESKADYIKNKPNLFEIKGLIKTVQSYSDLATLVNDNLSYDGIEVYVIDDKKSYKLIGEKWKAVLMDGDISGGGSVTEDAGLIQKQLEQLHYYGDKDIVPSDESLFTFVLTDNGKGYSVAANWDREFQRVDRIVIPYEHSGLPVVTIGASAFSECYFLTSVTIPNSVTNIEVDAFYHCPLKSIDIPDSVISIGDRTFESCNGLTNIEIPYGVKSIGGYAFASSDSLTNVNIPDSVESIGEDAFWESFHTTITCSQGSYAEQYAKEHDINYRYAEISQPDITPTENSSNLITSGGVYEALQNVSSGGENSLCIIEVQAYPDTNNTDGNPYSDYVLDESVDTVEVYNKLRTAYDNGQCIRFVLRVTYPEGHSVHYHMDIKEIDRVDFTFYLECSYNSGRILMVIDRGGFVEITDGIDDIPVENSDKFITSGGVYEALQDFYIPGGDSKVTIVDDLTSNDSDKALSANQGRVLSEKIETDSFHTIAMNESVPSDVLGNISNFEIKPVTQEVYYSITNTSVLANNKEHNGIEVPIVTTSGDIVVKNAEGFEKYRYTLPFMINSQGVSDEFTHKGVYKKWSDKFYITKVPTVTSLEKYLDSHPQNYLFTLEFTEEDFGDMQPPKIENIPIVSTSFVNMGTEYILYGNADNSGNSVWGAGIARANLSWNSEKNAWVLLVRTNLSSTDYLTKCSKIHFFYQLATPYFDKSVGFALGLEPMDSVTFESNLEYSKYLSISNFLYADFKKKIAVTEIDDDINFTGWIPKGINKSLGSFVSVANMLNNASKPASSDVDINNYNWIGDADKSIDYTDKIQKKIDAVYALGGGNIYLGNGEYHISSPLIIYANINLVGDHNTKLIQDSDNTHAIMLSGSNVEIKNLIISLAGDCTEDTACIYVNSDNTEDNPEYTTNYPVNKYCQHILIENVSFNGTYAFGKENGYSVIPENYDTYRGCGIISNRLYFNYAFIENCRFSHLYAGVNGEGGSNQYNIVCSECRIGFIAIAGYNTVNISGHSYYATGENGILSMSDSIVVSSGQLTTYVLKTYDEQWYKSIITFDGLSMGNKYDIVYGSMSHYSNIYNNDESKGVLTHIVNDYGRGNKSISLMQNKPYYIGSRYKTITGLTSTKEFNPVIDNALSGAGKWGTIASNTKFSEFDMSLTDVCRYPNDRQNNNSESLPYILSNTSPSKDNPIEITIDISNRIVKTYYNLFIQFDHRYVASDFVISFDTTGDGVYDIIHEVVGNNDVIYYYIDHQHGDLKNIYSIKISITKALQIEDLKYQISNYTKYTMDYNTSGLVGICNIGMVGDDYCGRSFLSECGGTIYGDLTVKGKISCEEGNIGGTDGIIDVLELPEVGNEKSFYRVLHAGWISGTDPNIDKAYCVDRLPEVGKSITSGNLTSYYHVEDNEVYGYIDDALSSEHGIPVGWYPISEIAQEFNIMYGGIITDIRLRPNDSCLCLLVEYYYYTYKDKWERIYLPSSTSPSVARIDWDGNMEGKFILDMSAIGYDEGIYYTKVSDDIITAAEADNSVISFIDTTKNNEIERIKIIPEFIDRNLFPGAFLASHLVVVVYACDELNTALGLPEGYISNGIYFFSEPSQGTYVGIWEIYEVTKKIPKEWLEINAEEVIGLSEVAKSGDYYDLSSIPDLNWYLRTDADSTLSLGQQANVRNKIDVYSKDEVYNKSEIYDKGYTTESRVLELINQEIGDIEEALKNIITIQEELMLPDGDEVKY